MNPSSHDEIPHQPNQFRLLRQRRFAPFFWVQFLGAANDSILKFAFNILVTHQISVAWLPPAMAGLAINGLFILPFLLFSATAGQLADRWPKEQLIKMVKMLEVIIVLVAAWGFIMHQVAMLLVCVTLMGLHSTIFGPVKYAYLPQHLNNKELTGGNGMVEMGTFVAIMLGTLVGGVLIAIHGSGVVWVAATCLGIALLGRVLAQWIPSSPATDPHLVMQWNPITVTWDNLKVARQNRVVYRSLMGISWMWFFGAVYLSQFAIYTKDYLHGNEHVASLLMVVFSIGVGLGSLACELLSRDIEVGLVPLGAIGMTVFSVDLYFATLGVMPPSSGTWYTLTAFLQPNAHWRVMADLALLSFFVGLFSVPMYALIQLRSQPTHRARIIAANNILNSIFMIASSLIVGVMLQFHITVPEIFFWLGIANAVVAVYIFWLVPEYFLRCLAWILTHLVYRFEMKGTHHIPVSGPAILVSNHVSFVDVILLMAASPRPIRFLMDERLYQTPVLHYLFRACKAIPIARRSENPVTYQQSMDAAIAVLQEGDLLGIFPEGGLTPDGTLQPFRGGVVKIYQDAVELGIKPVVIPMALTHLWGSFFSRIERENGKPTAMRRPFRRGIFNRVGLQVGASVADPFTPESLQQCVAELASK